MHVIKPLMYRTGSLCSDSDEAGQLLEVAHPLAHRTMLQLSDVMVICEAIDVDEFLISYFMNYICEIITNINNKIPIIPSCSWNSL